MILAEDAHATTTEGAVWAALRSVIDPELDESLVDLEFIEAVRVEGERVEVELRLPTFWCAPNFAYLMADDARRAVLGVPGVRDVRVVLKDHMYSEEISRGGSFVDVFGDQAEDGNLDDLRRLFQVKAFGMRQEQLVRYLLDAGHTAAEIVALRLSDLHRLPRDGGPLVRTYLERRQRIGLDTTRLITTVEGAPIAADELESHLQRMRRQRVSMTFNALTCRGLLETRYGLDPRKEVQTG